ncbi:putative mfs transporter protein [Venustampulla echinocandica]|uniref:Putative mfs transporter protein n=1 Tax=Venustampulla echinocandica TaxID=2656787 RepID=A0A370TNT8_9HELO|nr:putative mfs transporter protein [Venustampulla echinocandica]RDL37184.1 putative mfs transporter protein [Venustampulla echinocandica]
MPGTEINLVETNILPKPKLIVVFFGLAFALLISFIDQNSIGIALPTIGEDLNSATTISWAGTSSLIANTVFQVLYGRLSDILGRKVVFLSAVGLLALGDLLCGFAKTGPQLYAFRGISGVGSGGITALAMMIVSDVVTLENRGKYQGILGSCVGLGNAVGPFLAAAFVQKSTWRGLFWCICPLGVLSGVMVAFTLPPSKVNGDLRSKVKSIDYCGTGFSSAAILLLLIPISGGGTYFEWSSPMVISMITLGVISMIAFVIVEWKVATIPMMPLHLFKIPAVCAIVVQNFLFGIVYYSHLYYLPIYYQNARQFSPLLSAALTLPFVAGQSIFSVLSGQYISRRKRYGEVIWIGYALWTLGSGLILQFDRSTPRWKIILILIVEGAGVGNVFQPSLIASQAHSSKQDRAVVISVRNFLRAFGGALGLALSSAVYSNVLKKSIHEVSTPIPSGYMSQVLASILHVPDMSSLSGTQKGEVLDAYMKASRGVFIVWLPIMAVCLGMCVFIKDRGLMRPEEKAQMLEEARSSNEGAGPSEIEEPGVSPENYAEAKMQKNPHDVEKVLAKQ